MGGNRVLILSTALTGGGAETVARLMVEQLEGSACILFQNDADILVPGCHIWTIAQWRNRSLVAALLISLWRLFVIQLIKVKLRPAVTISHLEGPNFSNVLTVFGGRKVLFVHNRVSQNYQESNIRNRIKKMLVRALYHRADKVVGVSAEVCSELVEMFNVGRDKVLFLPNPIDREAIAEASIKMYGDVRDHFFEGRYLINIASLTEQKNHELLLRVFHQLITMDNKYNDLKLVLVGEGDRRDALRVLCAELGLSVFEMGVGSLTHSPQVCFVGFEQNPYPLLQHAMLLVMTSRWEGLPIALLEAMSLGIPCVVSDCSEGIRSVWRITSDRVDNSSLGPCCWTPYGALISRQGNDIDSIDSWTMAIDQLLDDTKLYDECSNACRERVKVYDVREVLDRWKREIIFPP